MQIENVSIIGIRCDCHIFGDMDTGATTQSTGGDSTTFSI